MQAGFARLDARLDLRAGFARLDARLDQLTDAGTDPKLADAITTAVREAADHGDHVTPANAETRLTWRMLGIAGLVLAVMRLLS